MPIKLSHYFCHECKTLKPNSEFYFNKKTGYIVAEFCKPCKNMLYVIDSYARKSTEQLLASRKRALTTIERINRVLISRGYKE